MNLSIKSARRSHLIFRLCKMGFLAVTFLLCFMVIMKVKDGGFQSDNTFTTEIYDGHRYVIYRCQSGGIAMTLHPEDGK